MSGTAIDFSKYEQTAPPGGGQIDFSKYETAEPTQTATPAENVMTQDLDTRTDETFGREVGSLGSSLAGIPGSIYHAFADPATQEETTEAGGPQEVAGAKRIGLGIGRLTAKPVLNAAEWYKDAAQGKIPNAYEQALSVAPEAMGVGGAGVISGKLADKALGAGRVLAKPENITAPIRLGARAAEAAANQKLVPLKPLLNIMSPADDAEAAQFKIPGRDVGLTKPVFSKTRLGPDEAPTGIPLISKTRLGPEPAPLGPPPVFSKTRLGPEAPPPEVGQARGLGGYVSRDPAEGLGRIPVATPEAPLNLPSEESTSPPETHIPRASVTENPVVGSLVRAMQKSGLPIAERPNLLLKGSGRVNRILGPDEELTSPLEKSLRQAKRQKSVNAGPLSRLR